MRGALDFAGGFCQGGAGDGGTVVEGEGGNAVALDDGGVGIEEGLEKIGRLESFCHSVEPRAGGSAGRADAVALHAEALVLENLAAFCGIASDQGEVVGRLLPAGE